MFIYGIKINIVLPMICMLLSACTATSGPDLPYTTADCKVGEICRLSGIFSVNTRQYGAVGVLEQGFDCISVAIPTEVIRKRKFWHGKKVVVEGEVFQDILDFDVLSYEFKGRTVLPGHCLSGKVIFLSHIERL